MANSFGLPVYAILFILLGFLVAIHQLEALDLILWSPFRVFLLSAPWACQFFNWNQENYLPNDILPRSQGVDDLAIALPMCTEMQQWWLKVLRNKERK